jgi:hypothetical protein
MDKSGAGAGFLRVLRFPLHNLHSICFSTIIFTVTRGWHNRPGVAAVPIASQNQIIIKKIQLIDTKDIIIWLTAFILSCKKIITVHKNSLQLTSIECLLQNLTALLYWLQGAPPVVLRECIVSTCKFAACEGRACMCCPNNQASV